MYFKPISISTLNDKTLKLIDLFTYYDRNVSSTENDKNIPLAKAISGIYRLSIVWKSDQSKYSKQEFFKLCQSKYCTMNTYETPGEAIGKLHKNAACFFKVILGSNTQQKNSFQVTHFPSHKSSK